MDAIAFGIIVMLLYDILFAVTKEQRYRTMGNVMCVFSILMVVMDVYIRIHRWLA